MLRDITLGQYYPADSVIHKLDPRVKLAGTMVLIISLFAFHSIEAYIVATLVRDGKTLTLAGYQAVVLEV